MNGPVVDLRDVVCLLGRFPALAGVTLTVEPGEIVLVEGPNGAGKSTLLRLCAGLLPLTAGSGSVLGHDLVTARRAVRRRVGLLGHDAGLYHDLTVRENVRFWTRAGGHDDDRVDDALAHVGMDGARADLGAARLSQGQKRRAALAILLARRPELWLLDEPHAGLDPEARDLVDRLVVGAARAGATVVFSSHDLDRAEALAGRRVTVVGGVTVDRPPTRGGPDVA